MNIKTLIAMGLAAPFLAACAGGGTNADKTIDVGFFDQSGDLSEMRAGIWIDPNGCDHWIIDDGVEGYLSQRLDRTGKPVCSGAGQPGYAVGPFRQGFNDGERRTR